MFGGSHETSTQRPTLCPGRSSDHRPYLPDRCARMIMPRPSARALDALLGGLGAAEKMPGATYGISATRCITGAHLRAHVPTSTCATCYALKGRYAMPAVATAHARRLEAFALPSFEPAMVARLTSRYRGKCARDRVFRWMDSGDLQGAWMLDKIVHIARALPSIRFWLPTREHAIVRRWLADNGPFPANLVVRVSAFLVGTAAPRWAENGSTVGANAGFLCPVKRNPRKKTCGSCRACWDPRIPSVDYKPH